MILSPAIGSLPKSGFPTAWAGVFSSGSFTGETVMRWQDIENEREKYAAYLCSREWCEKREQVRERASDKCERCFLLPMDSCHHLTYERKYNERLDDLQAICTGCHAFTHGKSDVDPTTFTSAIKTVQFDGAFSTCLLCPRCETSMASGIADAKVYEVDDGLVVVMTCACSCGVLYKLQVMLDSERHIALSVMDVRKVGDG